jgi:hypothetical protein
MNLQSIIRLARLSLRNEALIAEIRLRSYGRKAAFALFAGLTAMMALGFLNLALYQWLLSLWGPVWTPLAIAAANAALAAVALLAAVAVKPGPELQMAEDLRKLTTGALEDELHSATTVAGLISTLSGGGEGATSARLLIPAVVSIISALRRHRSKAEKKAR